MPQVQCSCRLVDHNVLREFCVRLLEAVGLTDQDSRQMAEMLVTTNLRGIDSHGVARLSHYIRRIEAGSIRPRAEMRMTRLGPAVAMLDGGHGLGHLVMRRAAAEAVALAREAGAGWVSVCNSSHCGALALFGLPIAEAGMIGLAFSHANPMVLPYDAKNQAFCGTNPVCITAPHATGKGDVLGDGALCLDMATSRVTWNAVVNAATECVPIPSGWATDADGNGTTDAGRAACLYPMGEYKGSGLGLMIDVLCALLSGSPYGPDIPVMYGDPSEPRRLGGLVGAIDIARFVPLDQFHLRLSGVLERWGNLTPAQPDGQVQFPGQPELTTYRRLLHEGIPVGLNVLRELGELAARYHVENTLDGP